MTYFAFIPQITFKCKLVFVLLPHPPFLPTAMHTAPHHEFHCFYRVVRKKINRVLCVCLPVGTHTPIQIWQVCTSGRQFRYIWPKLFRQIVALPPC